MTGLPAAVRRRLAALRATGDRGFISIWAMIIGTAVIIGFGGVLVDVGRRERPGDRRGRESPSRRAGADALAPGSLRQASPAAIAAYAPAATAAADRYLTEAGITEHTVSVAGRQVTVHATVHRGTKLLSAVGITQVSGSATSTATALYGNGVQGGG